MRLASSASTSVRLASGMGAVLALPPRDVNASVSTLRGGGATVGRLAVHFPSLEAFRTAARSGNVVPVYRELLADGDTPVSAYAKVGGGPGSFLLESVVGGQKWAAYSFIGVGAHATFVARGTRYEITRADGSCSS